MWSLLHHEDKSSIVQRKEKLKPLLNHFCNKKIHPVLKLIGDVKKKHDPILARLSYLSKALQKIAGISTGNRARV